MNMLDHALMISSTNKWPIFPVRPNKAPYVKGGFNSASSDPKKIREWWKTWPDAAIGLPTGKPTGLVVVDVDVKNGHRGDLSFEGIENEFGPFETKVVETPSGGKHYYFRSNTEGLKCRTNFLDGVDIRAEGGYVVAEGSVIDSGEYKALPYSAIQAIPINFHMALSEGIQTKCEHDEEGVPEGMRNNHIFNLAVKLRSQALPLEKIREKCEEIAAKCDPPYPMSEVRDIVKRVCQKYKPVDETSKDQVKATRALSDREDRVDWVKLFSNGPIYKKVHVLKPAIAGGYIKLVLSFLTDSRMSRSEVSVVSGLHGNDLEELIQCLQKEDELYFLSHVDDIFEDAYSSLVVSRVNGGRGGRPKKPIGSPIAQQS